MNYYQISLFNNLMILCNDTEVFYFKDQEIDGVTYRIFSYRLAQYSDFLKPDALECRGHMFEMDGNQPVRLATLPFPKFFNMNENPITDEKNLDFTQISEISDKADGSLISTYKHKNTFRLKSKTSLSSSHCESAMMWLNRSENSNMKAFIEKLVDMDYTVNMEWVSPYYEHKIVLHYPEPKLQILGIRNNQTGEDVSLDQYYSDKVLSEYLVKRIVPQDPKEYIFNVYDMEQIEGIVVRFNDGTRVKIKTNWYLARHRVKDSITSSPKTFFETIITDTIDDVKSILHDDADTIKLIDDAINHVSSIHNHIMSTVESFYEENKNLSRKEYAMKAFSVLDQKLGGLAMRNYTHNKVDFCEFALKGDNFKTVYKFDEFLNKRH